MTVMERVETDMEVSHNNRKKLFEVTREGRTYTFPYAECDPKPVRGNYVVKSYVDPELGGDGLTYVLEDGTEGSVLWEWVKWANKDPDYLRDVALLQLTLLAEEKVAAAGISKGEIRRRLGTSPAQMARLLDREEKSKTLDGLVRLLAAVGCVVEFSVKDQPTR